MALPAALLLVSLAWATALLGHPPTVLEIRFDGRPAAGGLEVGSGYHPLAPPVTAPGWETPPAPVGTYHDLPIRLVRPLPASPTPVVIQLECWLPEIGSVFLNTRERGPAGETVEQDRQNLRHRALPDGWEECTFLVPAPVFDGTTGGDVDFILGFWGRAVVRRLRVLAFAGRDDLEEWARSALVPVFRQILGRPPTPGEQARFATAFAREEITFDRLAANLAGSREYRERFLHPLPPGQALRLLARRLTGTPLAPALLDGYRCMLRERGFHRVVEHLQDSRGRLHPPGAVLHQDQWFLVAPGLNSWEMANNFFRRQGGALATPANVRGQAFLNDLVGGKAAFLGGRNAGDRWWSTLSNLDFAPWADPAEAAGTGTVVMNLHAGAAGAWWAYPGLEITPASIPNPLGFAGAIGQWQY